MIDYAAGPADAGRHRARPGRAVVRRPGATTRTADRRRSMPGSAGRATAAARAAASTSEGAASASTCRSTPRHAVPAGGVAGTACAARWRHHQLWRDRAGDRLPAARARGRRGGRAQPGRHHRALPPRGRQQRLAHRLCRRAAAQDGTLLASTAKATERADEPRDLSSCCCSRRLWGASFLFMRLGAAEFGPLALAALRVAVARGRAAAAAAVARRGPRCAGTGSRSRSSACVNSALPFLCFGYAAWSINAGLASIFNATAPLFGGADRVGLARRPLTPPRVLGLVIGFVGVIGLAWDKADFKPGAEASALRWRAGMPGRDGAVRPRRQLSRKQVPGRRAADGDGRRQPARGGLAAVAARPGAWPAQPAPALAWGAVLRSRCSAPVWPTCCTSG